MTRPETRYARSGDTNIAYQIVGDGPLDLVYVHGWVSNVDFMWDEPSYARFLERLASFSRVILFDNEARDCPTPCRSTSRPRWSNEWTTSAP